MLTRHDHAQPRWRATYQTCGQCGFQFWQEAADQQTCKLCDSVMGRTASQRINEAAIKKESRPRRKPVLPDRICDVCGATYTPPSTNSRYCTDRCRNEAGAELERLSYRERKGVVAMVRTCICGTEFTTYHPLKVTCSASCRRYRKNQQRRERRAA